MLKILRILSVGLYQTFPADHPVLNRVGHALASCGVALVVMVAVTVASYLPSLLVGYDAAFLGATHGMAAGIGAYGFREAEQTARTVASGRGVPEGTGWDFYASVIGAALPLLFLLLVRFLNLL